MLERKIIGMSPAHRLGAMRVLITFSALIMVLFDSFTGIAELPQSWYKIDGVMRIFPDFIIFALTSSALYLFIFKAVLCLFMILSLTGILTRISLFISTLMLTVYLGIISAYVGLQDFRLVTLYLLFFLIWLPSEKAIAFESRSKEKIREAEDLSLEIGWSVFFLRAVLVLSYFQAGISKLMHTGLYWAAGWNQKHIFLDYRLNHGSFDALWTHSLLQWPNSFWKMLGIAVLGLQLFFPTALVSWRVRRVYPVLALLVFGFVQVLKGAVFWDSLLPLFILWDWDRILRLVQPSPFDRRRGYFSFWPRRA